ncbi:MAG: PIN domain-containing protein [Candidatus Binataceae bacterium]
MLDTAVFIVRETGRQLGELPETAAISVVTLAELHLGVLMAQGQSSRARRLRTLAAVQHSFEPLPIDAEVARAFAEIVAAAGARGQRPKIMDAWIAATAMSHGLIVFTQDKDFASIPQIRVMMV